MLSVSIAGLKHGYGVMANKYSGHQEVLDRLERALEILVKSQEYDITYAGNSLFIVTKREKKRVINYEVNVKDKTCTCPDANQICKHRIACLMLIEAKREDNKHAA